MDLNPPLLITNFKAYQEATGINAVNLAMEHERLANEMEVNLAVAVQAIDIKAVASAVSIPVLAQHVDPVGYGAYTGFISVDALKQMGVDGSLLDHSEHPISEDAIANSVKKLKEFGMFVVLCANTVEEAVRYVKYDPDYIAFEPPELIGGDVSISKSSPELIEDVVAKVGRGKILVGAGVKTGEDVKIAMQLGASGILVASGIVKAENHMDALRDLCTGFRTP